MLPSPALPARRIVGLMLLACWLGWTAVALAAMAAPDAGDSAAAHQLLGLIKPQLPAIPAATPQLIRLLPATPCSCAGDEAAWTAATQATFAAGGRVAVVSVPPGYSETAEILLLGSDGEPRYGGPLRPPIAVCGSSPNGLATWLPELLADVVPAVFLPPDCSC
jgi:hypothetical protein